MAAVDYFLKIDGIPGESLDSKHKDEIQLDSWSWGESQIGAQAAGGGGGAGKVQMQDFRFAMQVNKAGPKLFLACAQGTHIKEALLTCREAGGKQQEYLKMKLSDLLVTSYNIGGGERPEVVKPVENIDLNFAKIEVSYAPQDPKGALKPYITHWYDLKTQEGK